MCFIVVQNWIIEDTGCMIQCATAPELNTQTVYQVLMDGKLVILHNVIASTYLRP